MKVWRHLLTTLEQMFPCHISFSISLTHSLNSCKGMTSRFLRKYKINTINFAFPHCEFKGISQSLVYLFIPLHCSGLHKNTLELFRFVFVFLKKSMAKLIICVCAWCGDKIDYIQTYMEDYSYRQWTTHIRTLKCVSFHCCRRRRLYFG